MSGRSRVGIALRNPRLVVREVAARARRFARGPAYRSVPLVHLPYVHPGIAARTMRAWNRRIERTQPVPLERYQTMVPAGDIEEHIACLLCGDRRMQPLFAPAGRSSDAKGGKRWRYRVVRCPSCGFLYRNPNVKPERLGELYATKYSSFLSGKYEKNRRRRYTLSMEAFAPLFTDGTGRRLFDYGCGTGIFLQLAHERGFETFGVDLSEDSIVQARQRPGGDNTYHGAPLDVPEIAAGGFDVITMWSVLAHLPRAAEDLGVLRKLLKDDGFLFIFTVNADSLLLKANGSAWNGFTENHLCFYNADTLKRLAAMSGFSRVETRPFFGDTIEAGVTKLDAKKVQRLRHLIETTGQGNMMRAVLFP